MDVTLRDHYYGLSGTASLFDGRLLLGIRYDRQNSSTMSFPGAGRRVVDEKETRGTLYVRPRLLLPDISDDALARPIVSMVFAMYMSGDTSTRSKN